MNAVKLLALINKQNLSHFHIRDIAQLASSSVNTVFPLLKRLEQLGLLVRLKRGLWGFPDKVQLFALPAILTEPIPTYVSLYSALSYHGFIEQIPTIIYAMTAGRTARIANSLATVSFHHAEVPFVTGYTFDVKTEVAMATAEKALVDTLYLQSSKSPLFHKLPEIEIPSGFSKKKAEAFIALIPHKAKQKSTLIRLEKILGF
jgi:predicted transcriptional regulator of viral defense system